MGAVGYSLTGITDIGIAGTVENVLDGKSGITLRQPSRVEVFLTREVVEVTCGVNIGGTQVLAAGSPVNISTVVGSLPSTQDDKVCDVIGGRNDLIVVSGANANAAAKELRALLRITPIDDVILQDAIRRRRGA